MAARRVATARSSTLSRAALFAALGLVLLSGGGLTGGAAAGVSDYPATLYLSGATSAVIGTSETLVTAAGPGQPSGALTLAAGGPGALSTTAYSYGYTIVDPTGGETPMNSPVAPSITGVSGKSVIVSGLPTGVTVLLYRKGTAGLTAVYRRVATLTNNTSSTYTDNMDDTTAGAQPILPQTQNRPIANIGTGYYKFVPGVPLMTTTATTTAVTSPIFSGEGWIVDAAGSATIPAGTWTFTTNVKGQANNGVAHLVIGMWKVSGSGAVVDSVIIDPTTTGENTSANIATAAGTSSPIVTTVSNIPAITLGADEHLYVQFWRRQTTASFGTPITTLYAYDGTTRIVRPSTPNTPALGTLARRVNTAPQISAGFSDPDASDTGTLSFQLCADSACATVLQSNTTSSVANGASGAWTPSTLAGGTYYVRARAQDAAGNQSDWSSATAFVVDMTPPNVPTLISPAAASRVGTSQLTATFSDVDAADSGTLTFQLCSDTACTTVVSSPATANVANGANASWTPTAADGSVRWRVRAQDAAGNLSAWSASRTFTLDTAPPSATTLDAPADGAMLKALPSLGSTFVDSDATDSGVTAFQICADAGCSNIVAAGSSTTLANGGHGTWTPSALADGTYFVRVRDQDVAGNASAWSAVSGFALDMTPPGIPTGSGIADGTGTATAPILSATFADAGGGSGTVTFQLCSDAACSRIVATTTSSTLASGGAASWAPLLNDGTYSWRTRATDTVGNTSAWSASSSFTLDTTPPPAPTVPATRPRVRTAPLLTVDASSDTSRIEIELCEDPGCAVVQAAGFGDRAWQAPALADGVYYWRALAQDGVGNESGWSRITSFVIDTVPPDVPSLTTPPSDASVSLFELSGTFASSDMGDDGKLGFQVCNDAACTSIVTTAWTADASVGSLQRWTALGLSDGMYFWRACAQDAAGNTSAWSETRQLTLDTTPPAKPTRLQATRSKKNLVLSWRLPAGSGEIRGYALFVNGKRTRTIAADKLAIDIALRANDKRTFAIAAIDSAGNVGASTRLVMRTPQALKQTKAKAKAKPKKKTRPGKR